MKINVWVLLAIFSVASIGLWLGSFLPIMFRGSNDVADERRETMLVDFDIAHRIMGERADRVVRVMEGVLSSMHYTPEPLKLQKVLYRITTSTDSLRSLALITNRSQFYKVDTQATSAGYLLEVLDPRNGIPCKQSFIINPLNGERAATPFNSSCTFIPSSDPAYAAMYNTGGTVIAMPTEIDDRETGGHRLTRYGCNVVNMVDEALSSTVVMGDTSGVLYGEFETDSFSARLPRREHYFIAVFEIDTGNVVASTQTMQPDRIYAVDELGIPGIGDAKSQITDSALVTARRETTVDGGRKVLFWQDVFLYSARPSRQGALRVVLVLDKGAIEKSYRDSISGVTVACSIAFAVVIAIQVIFSYVVTNGSNELDAIVSEMERATEDFSLAAFNEREEEKKLSILAEIAEVQQKFASVQRAINIASVYIPKEVVTSVLISGAMSMEVTPLECAILFVDMDNFVQMCEEVSVDDFADITRRYFDVQTTAITRNGGTIDKFIGDCIMAMWGAPMPIDNKRLRALTAALQLRDGIERPEHAEFFRSHRAAVAVRVGVHIGTVSAGNIGCDARVSYTILGDPVNLTSRLQSANRHLGTRIIVSDDITAESNAEGVFAMRPLGRLKVVGKDMSIGVNELMGLHPSFDLKAFDEFDTNTDGASVAATSINAADHATSVDDRSEHSHRSHNSANKYKRGSLAPSASNRSTSVSNAGSKKSGHSSRSSERAARLQRKRMDQINNIGKAMRVSLQVCKQCSDAELSAALEYESIITHYTNGAFNNALEELRQYRSKEYGRADPAAKMLQRQCELLIRNPPVGEWRGEIELTAK